jgi:hypothetical protein
MCSNNQTQYRGEHNTIKYKYTCNKKDLLTTNFTGIVPSLDCSNIVTDGSCLYLQRRYIMSLSLRLVKLYKSC